MALSKFVILAASLVVVDAGPTVVKPGGTVLGDRQNCDKYRCETNTAEGQAVCNKKCSDFIDLETGNVCYGPTLTGPRDECSVCPSTWAGCPPKITADGARLLDPRQCLDPETGYQMCVYGVPDKFGVKWLVLGELKTKERPWLFGRSCTEYCCRLTPSETPEAYGEQGVGPAGEKPICPCEALLR